MNTATSAANLEEAANVASEFISSLDNLPNEVQHLLQEIKLKETRCQELQQEISRDQARYIKHTLRSGTSVPPSPVTPSTTPNANDILSTATPNGGSPKSHLPERIATAYAEMDALVDEKVVLAQRVIDLIVRTRARLDSDLARVRILQGESPEDVQSTPSLSLTSQQALLPTPYTNKRLDSAYIGSPHPVLQIGEISRNPVSVTADSVVSSLSPPVSGPQYNKKRRLTSNTSIKLPSPAPAIPVPGMGAGHTSSYARSRLSRQVQLRPQDDKDTDADAEGEEDLEGEDADEDSLPYCFCRKQSFGDMIGCDSPECPYQWFHISCVGVKQPLPDKWYCPECKTKSIPDRRKGRKK